MFASLYWSSQNAQEHVEDGESSEKHFARICGETINGFCAMIMPSHIPALVRDFLAKINPEMSLRPLIFIRYGGIV
jgi:hypothetical protein